MQPAQLDKLSHAIESDQPKVDLHGFSLLVTELVDGICKQLDLNVSEVCSLLKMLKSVISSMKNAELTSLHKDYLKVLYEFTFTVLFRLF